MLALNQEVVQVGVSLQVRTDTPRATAACPEGSHLSSWRAMVVKSEIDGNENQTSRQESLLL